MHNYLFFLYRLVDMILYKQTIVKSKVKKGKFLYSAVSSLQDRSKRFTLYAVKQPLLKTPRLEITQRISG